MWGGFSRNEWIAAGLHGVWCCARKPANDADVWALVDDAATIIGSAQSNRGEGQNIDLDTEQLLEPVNLPPDLQEPADAQALLMPSIMRFSSSRIDPLLQSSAPAVDMRHIRHATDRRRMKDPAANIRRGASVLCECRDGPNITCLIQTAPHSRSPDSSRASCRLQHARQARVLV